MNSLHYRDISMMEEAGGCLLCHNASCTAACPFGLEPDRFIRSMRFENNEAAAQQLPDILPCVNCPDKLCVSACVKAKLGRAVPVDRLMTGLATVSKTNAEEADLSVDFCGVRCENPFLLSSSVVASNYEMVAQAFEMGWAGAAFKTIGTFTSNKVSPRFDALRKEALPFVGFKNIEQISEYPLEDNIAFIRQLKKDFPGKVIVASIMGQDEAEWTYLAKRMEEAGADIIECNFSCPHMAVNGLGSDVGQNPEMVATFTKAVRRGTDLPVLAKMTPNIGNMELPAKAAIEAGATGIAAINTLKSVMNVNLETFSSGPDVLGKTSVGGYSGKAVKPIALRFIQAMKSCAPLKDVPISGMGGIETWRDAAEFMALGCGTVQVTTAVMQYGYRIIDDMISGMKHYLGTHGYKSAEEIVGRALECIILADNLNRKTICYPRFDRRRCVACGRCFISCRDGGHQALRLETSTGQPMMDGHKCVGCHLCITVCPSTAISAGARVPKKEKACSEQV